MNLTPHPAADVFPMMSDGELASLSKNIKEHGLRHPIVIIDAGGKWQILDGRNRYEACKRAGIHPTTTVYDGADPISFVWSLNCERRHLTDGQKAMIGERFATMRRGGDPAARANACTQALGSLASQEAAAKLVGVSRSSVQVARKIRTQGAPELVAMVEAGAVSLRAADRVAALPVEEQQRLVANGPAAVVEHANARPTEPARPRLVVHNGGALQETEREGVFRAPKHKLYDLSVEPKWRTRHEDHAAVRACLERNMTVSDVVEKTGLDKSFVHHSMAPYRIRPKVMENVIEDTRITAETWASWAHRIEQKWPGASRDERDQLIAELESCRRSAATFVRELKKDARTGGDAE